MYRVRLAALSSFILPWHLGSSQPCGCRRIPKSNYPTDDTLHQFLKPRLPKLDRVSRFSSTRAFLLLVYCLDFTHLATHGTFLKTSLRPWAQPLQLDTIRVLVRLIDDFAIERPSKKIPCALQKMLSSVRLKPYIPRYQGGPEAVARKPIHSRLSKFPDAILSIFYIPLFTLYGTIGNGQTKAK